MSAIARPRIRIEKRVGNGIVKISNLIRGEAKDGGRENIIFAESAKVEMGSFFTDVAGVEENFTGQLFLESEAPSLLVRCIQAATLYRSYGGETDVIEGPQTVSWRGRNSARKWRIELAGGITQGVPRRGVIEI